MFEEKDEQAPEQVAKTSPISADEVPRFNSSVGDEVSPVVAGDVEVRVVQPGSPVRDAENVHTIDCRYYPERGLAEVTAEREQKKRTVCLAKSLDIFATTSVDVVAGGGEAISVGKLIAIDKSGEDRDTYALVFSRSRSIQATGDTEVDTKRRSAAEKPSDAMADVSGEMAHPVSLCAIISGGRSHASVVPCSGVEGADKVALQTHIHGLRAENKKLLARRAVNQMLHMDNLLNLCVDNTNRSALNAKVKKFKKQLKKVRAE